MNNFDIIESGFNNADETINFGTRSIDFGNLYEISTVACLKCEDDLASENVYLDSILKNSQLFLSTNRSLKIFEDIESANINFNTVFNSEIATICVSNDCKFLLCCLKNGLAHLFDVSDTTVTKCVFSKNLLPNESESDNCVKSFVERSDPDETSFLIVLTSGKVHRILVVLNNEDNEENISKPVVTFESFYDFKMLVNLAAFSFPILLVSNDNKLSVFDVEKHFETSDSNNCIDFVKICGSGQKFIGLNSEGNLYLICSLTLIVFPMNHETFFEDFMVIGNVCQKQIVAVTKTNEQGLSFLQMLHLDLTTVFSLKISHPVHLIQLDNVNEETLFVSKVIKSEHVVELRIQRIYEAQAELRLQKLIKKDRLDEAEAFAKKFSLDPMIVFKARARYIVDNINCNSEDVENLIKILDTIEDDNFKLICCSDVLCNSYQDVRKVLKYGSSLVPKSNLESDKTEFKALFEGIFKNKLFKFDSYMAVYTTYNQQNWARFSNVNLFEELITLLKNFQIEESIILCNRLGLGTVTHLSTDKIEEVLEIIDNLPFNTYRPFLPTFIPTVINYDPAALSVFVKWLHNRIFQLEKRDVANFPENSIAFAENILDLLKVDKDLMGFQRQCKLNKDGIDNLHHLMCALKGLQTLKNSFRIKYISLSEYLTGPETVIRILLNMVMPPEDYEYLLKEFLYKFMLRNNFKPDEILFAEIKNSIKYDQNYWIHIVETILSFISSVDVKLAAIKEILDTARVPWDEKVRKIGLSALQYNHRSVHELKGILENEPRLVVLRNPIYGIKDKSITTLEEFEFVARRLVYVNGPSMESDVLKLCKTQEERELANNILVPVYIKKGNFNKAMNLLGDNPPEIIFSCSKSLLKMSEIVIESKWPNRPSQPSQNQLKDNHYQIIGSVVRKLLDNCNCSIQKECFEDDLKVIRGLYNLNKNFNRCYRVNDLRCKRRKLIIVDEIISELSSDLDKDLPNLLEIFDKCSKLADYLSEDKNEILVKFCQKIGEFKVILKAAQYVLEKSDPSSKDLCLLAVLLLKNVGTFCPSKLSDSLNVSDDFSTESGETVMLEMTMSASNFNVDFLEGLSIAEKMLRMALVKAKDEELPKVVSVMNWINVGFFVIRAEEEAEEKELALFPQVYRPVQHSSPSYSLFSFINGVFEIFCSYLAKQPNIGRSFDYLSHFNENVDNLLSEEKILEEISLLPRKIDALCAENQNLTAYSALVTLQNSLKSLELKTNQSKEIIHNLNLTITRKSLPKLIDVVVGANKIDQGLLEDLFLATGPDYMKYVMKYVKVYKRHPKKLQEIASVGVRLLNYHRVAEKDKQILLDLVLTCKWWKKLKQHVDKLQYVEFFKSNASNRLDFLINMEIVDVDLIKDYCLDYKLGKVQVFYVNYLKAVFSKWKPDYELQTDLNGSESLTMKSDENELFDRCQEIIKVIDNKDGVSDILNSVWDSANFYYYEIFLCILKIWETLKNPKPKVQEKLASQLLLFLKKYRRFSAPEQSEEELFYTTFPKSQVLDPLSRFRLPFSKVLFTTDIWNIIRSEITLKSYKSWFGAAAILQKNLKTDDICVYAVKEIVSSGILGKEANQDGNCWQFYSKFENLFEQVDECVQNISDLEKATSVIYHLMYHTPNGADKVNAAHLTYKYLVKYKEKNANSVDVDKAYLKVKTKYLSFSAIHILQMFQLADDKYMQLAAYPNDLINALYMDERILKQSESVGNSVCPDINKAVDCLAEVFNLDCKALRLSLLKKWLGFSGTISHETTVNYSADFDESGSEDENNLKRAIYVCDSSEGKVYWRGYLLNVGTEETDIDSPENLTYLFRAKALKCFCAISDVETIAQMTEITYEDLMYYIDKLMLISELQCLGLTFTIEKLDRHSKKDLLKRLSKTGSPPSLKIMAMICITYSIDSVSYWEFIINGSIKLGMTEELKKYVDFLGNKYCYKSFYVNAWQCVIDGAFFKCKNLKEKDDLYQFLINMFLLIQSCPVVFSINFKKIIQKCVQVKKYEFAAVLMQYLPEENKEYDKCILESDTLLADLDKLTVNGIWGVQKVKLWMHNNGLRLNN